MGVESRLYAKLTLDYADSHKIAPLSDAAFRAHVTMILWSRRMLTDGKIPGPMARVFAKPRVLTELTSNDPINPSLIKIDDDYWLHDFTQHQSSRADVEAASERNRSNGQRGGIAKAKRVASESLSETEAKTYTETETETETDQKHVQGPARDHSDDFAAFWEVYPRKQGKLDALKAYKAALNGEDAASILRGAQAYALLHLGDDKTFLKLPAGWLRGERWEDESITPSRPALGNIVTESPMCPIHPGYPDSPKFPCMACAREASLPEGNEF